MNSRLVGLLTTLGVAGIVAYLYQKGTIPELNAFITQLNLKTKGVLQPLTGNPETVAEKAIRFIADKEGFSSKAYPDPAGQQTTWSIGYGHQIRPGDGLSRASVITEAKAFELLSQDVQSAFDCVYGAVTVGLTPNQQAALVSFAYNVGCAAFRTSTLLRKINQRDFAGAADEFGRWIYAGGIKLAALKTRRDDEKALFLGA